MKAFLEQVEIGNASSIKVKTYVRSTLDVPLHYHPEPEIVLIVKGSGQVYVQDSATGFSGGDLFLFGSNLPHLFVDAKGNRENAAEVVVIQFRENLFDPFRHLPEFQGSQQFLLQMRQGIKVKPLEELSQLVLQLSHSEGMEKFNRLSHLIDFIIHKTQYQTLAGRLGTMRMGAERLRVLSEFLATHYQEAVTVDDAAARLHLGKTSFCRFLKKETGKTFTEWLNATRIGEACRLLRETALTATQVSYATGFNHPAYFHRQFKNLQGISPLEYKQRYGSNIISA